MSETWHQKNLGPVSAYAVAKRNGWTGTEQEWEALQAAAPQKASDAEAYAAGTRSGTPVGNTDPAYHNNAEYYKGQAANEWKNAKAFADGTRDGEPVTSDDPAYHDNAAYFKDLAADEAEDAEAWANGTRGGVPVTSGDPAYEKNGPYWEGQAKLQKEAAQAAAETASAAYNVNLLAPNYDATATYNVGDHVIYSGGYYRCISAITTAEAWTAAHWTQDTVGAEASSLKSAFGQFATESIFPPIPEGCFARGTVLNGVYNSSIKYRVATPELYTVEKDTTFYINAGFKAYMYFYIDGSYQSATLLTEYNVSAGTQLKIVILRITEDTSEIADVSEFVSQLNSSNKLLTLESNVQDCTEKVNAVVGTVSASAGTQNIDACSSNISQGYQMRFAGNPVVNGNCKIDTIVYKSNTAKNVDFYIGKLLQNNVIEFIAKYTCSVVSGTNILKNGINFNSDIIITDDCLIGFRGENSGANTNGYFGGTEGSYTCTYTTTPVVGNKLQFDAATYGIGLYMTLKPVSISEVIDLVENIETEINSDNSKWMYAMDSILCIGDSLTKGSPANSETMPYPLKQNYPWYLSRMIGAECANAGDPGIDTKGWYTNHYSQYNMQNYNTFIIFLGTNGGLTNTLDTDVDPYTDYHDFADTETGYYCRLIENIYADRPGAFIVLVNTWYNGSNQPTTRATIDAIGEKYSIPVIETVNIMPYSINPVYHGNYDNVHCSKAGYLALASLICDGIKEYIANNPNVANKAMSQG